MQTITSSGLCKIEYRALNVFPTCDRVVYTFECRPEDSASEHLRIYTEMAKAKAFYTEQLGFQVTKDFGQGDQHWVSLELPGGGASLTLTTMHGKMKPGTMTLYLSTPLLHLF